MGGKTFGEQLQEASARTQAVYEVARSIVATAKGKTAVKIVLVGGNDTVLRGPWPPWYEVVHFDRQTMSIRIRQVLTSKTVDCVVVFQKFQNTDQTRLVKQICAQENIPVFLWAQNPDQLSRNIGQFIEKKTRVVAQPKAPPELVTQNQQPVAQLAPPPEPEPEPQPPVVVDAPPPETPEPEVADNEPDEDLEKDLPPAPTLTDAKKVALQRSAELLSSVQRRDAWNSEEWEMLLIALEECKNNGKVFVKTMKTLGCKRTIAAMLFALDRATERLKFEVDPELLRQLRALSRKEWTRAQQRKMAKLAKEQPATPADAQAVVPTPVEEKIKDAGAAVAMALPGDDRFRKTVDFIVLGVEIGRMTKEQGFDEIVKLLGR